MEGRWWEVVGRERKVEGRLRRFRRHKLPSAVGHSPVAGPARSLRPELAGNWR